MQVDVNAFDLSTPVGVKHYLQSVVATVPALPIPSLPVNINVPDVHLRTKLLRVLLVLLVDIDCTLCMLVLQ